MAEVLTVLELLTYPLLDGDKRHDVLELPAESCLEKIRVPLPPPPAPILLLELVESPRINGAPL